MSVSYYVLTTKERKLRLLLKEYLKNIETVIPQRLKEMEPAELNDLIEPFEMEEAIRNGVHFMVGSMENYLGNDQERMFCTISGTTHMRRFDVIPIIDDDLIVEDEYGNVYNLDEFEDHLKRSYPAISKKEIAGMVRKMRLWEERARPSR